MIRLGVPDFIPPVQCRQPNTLRNCENGQFDFLRLMVSAGFSAGETDVAVPFEEVQATTKNKKVHLVMNGPRTGSKAHSVSSTTATPRSGFPTKSDPAPVGPDLGLGSDYPRFDAPSVQKLENCRRASALSSDECGNT